MDLPEHGHEPVMPAEVLRLLEVKAGQTVVDCTIGRGGHAAAIAPLLGPEGMLIGLDADPRNLEFADTRLRSLSGPPLRFRLFHANFSQLGEVLAEAGVPAVDAILADLGVSTNQLFDDRYGLSFDKPMDLDMRLDPGLEQSAADLVNHLDESELADVLYKFAQERYSRRIARKIVEARRISPIKTTERLAELARSAMPRREGFRRLDPATRTFLALRMAVNRETENLDALLKEAPRWLKPGGRWAVISFQSMEDRAVKQAFRSMERTGLLRQLVKKPLCPTPDELAGNPRSRSARLRAAQKAS